MRRRLAVAIGLAAVVPALLALAGVFMAAGSTAAARPAAATAGAATATATAASPARPRAGTSPAWVTYHRDGGRSGADPDALPTSGIALAWQTPKLGGKLYAQPLILGKRVYVATTSNDVYALDAGGGSVLWHRSAGTPVPSSALPCGDIAPTVGIVSTPVIDPVRNELFMVAGVWDGSHAHHELIGYSLDGGAELLRRVVDPPGATPENQIQRAALALTSGRIVAAFGGNDGDCASYHGYVVASAEDGSGPLYSYGTPTRGGGIWSASGPVVDPSGDVYATTGNAADGPHQPYDYGDSILKLDPSLRLLASFAPSSWAQDNTSDTDLGSVGAELLPGGVLFQGGKNGNGYLVSAANPGGIGHPLYQAPVCDSYGGDAYAAGVIYVACTDGVHALGYDQNAARFHALWTGPVDADGPPIVSGGLVWVVATGDSLLYGLDPASGAVRVQQQLAGVEHFVSPSAAGGRLFLGTGQTVTAFTEVSSAPPPAPPKPPHLQSTRLHARSGGRVTVVLDCPSTCSGTLTLASASGRTLARASFGPRQGRVLVTLRLGRGTRRSLAARRRLTVRIVLAPAGAARQRVRGLLLAR